MINGITLKGIDHKGISLCTCIIEVQSRAEQSRQSSSPVLGWMFCCELDCPGVTGWAQLGVCQQSSKSTIHQSSFMIAFDNSFDIVCLLILHIL